MIFFFAQEDLKLFPFKVTKAPDGGILINLMYEKVYLYSLYIYTLSCSLPLALFLPPSPCVCVCVCVCVLLPLTVTKAWMTACSLTSWKTRYTSQTQNSTCIECVLLLATAHRVSDTQHNIHTHILINFMYEKLTESHSATPATQTHITLTAHTHTHINTHTHFRTAASASSRP